MFKLNIDPKLYHHYFISVGIEPMSSKENAGKMFLKYSPIHFTNDDIKKMRNAAILSKDKLFKTSSSEAIKINDCEELEHSITGMMLASKVNQCTIHHFSSEYEMSEEDFETLVEAANISVNIKELLLKSIIRR